MQLSVVVPVRNEADNVAPLVEEIRDALEGRCDYEVVYVDDGSTDDTLERLIGLQRGFARLRVLRHARCCGQSTAIRTPDTGCGLKLFPRELFLELPYFDHMHRFLPALVRRAGGEVVSVEVNHRPRTRGRSKYGLHNRLWASLVDLAGVMWLMRRSRLPQVEEVRPE